jgi:DNA-binding NarL/FixJ family response regulator
MLDLPSGAAPEPRPRWVTVLLIDATTLTRESLCRLLHEGARDFAVLGVADCGEATMAAAGPADRPDAVLLNIKAAYIADRAVMDDVAVLAERMSGAPIIVLSERDDALAALNAIQLGLRGYFPATLGVELLIAAIRLVIAGGSFVPPAVLRACAAQDR